MKSLLFFWALLLSSHSYATTVDHLSWTGGAKGFCNILAKLEKKPEVHIACAAIILVKADSFTEEELRNQKLGQVADVLDYKEVNGTTIYIVSRITVEQLEAIRYDERIISLAPDMPLSGDDAFTVRN
ncbi:MAG: hypothetical protein M9962_12565 [Oligoflexia bacterium]|nr:hypothetical protein [Oligoflexia bacterium]